MSGSIIAETGEDTPAEGTPIDPELLAVIQRVAHREHLLDGVGHAPHVRTATTRSTRRRPAIGFARTTGATRGTTARKVTWS